MSIAKVRSALIWPLFILLSQLAFSAGSFYAHYRFQALATARAVEATKLETRLRDVHSESINKEAVLSLMKDSVQDTERYAELLFWFGVLSACTASFAAQTVISLRKNHAPNIEV
jgi:hypothetical protein